MTTTAALVEETRRHLQSGAREEMNRLNGSITNSATTLTAEFSMGSIKDGAMLAIDYEIMLVWPVSGQVATVQRGMLGSTAAAHNDDALIYVNARFPTFAIFEALREEIQSYSSPRHGLFRMRTVDVTYSAGTVGYDLTGVTDLLDVYELRWKGHTTGEWPEIRSWSLSRDMATSEFASTLALQLYDGAGPGRSIRVRYKAPYASLLTTSVDVGTDTGLHAEAHDIPPLGAAARLVAPREVKRAFTESQPESRAAAEVPPGSNRGAAATLLTLRDARLREEAVRLKAKYPTLAKVH